MALEIRLVGEVANLPLHGGSLAEAIESEEGELARTLPQHAHKHFNGCRFSRPVRAEQSDDFTRLYGKAQAIHRPEFAKVARDIVEMEDGRKGGHDRKILLKTSGG